LTRRTLGKTDLEALSSHRTSLSHFLGDEQSESAPFLLVYSTSIFLSLSASLSLSLSYLNPTRVFLPRPQFRNEFESRRARRRLEPLAAIMPRFSRVFLELKFKGGTKLKSKAKIRFRLQVTLYYSRNYPAVCPLSVSFDPFYVLSLSLSLSLTLSLIHSSSRPLLFHLALFHSHVTSVSILRHAYTNRHTRRTHTRMDVMEGVVHG
jgi:hypothetical protein